MSQLIYTTGWSQVKTEHKYCEWLKSLKDRDHVAIQKFHPATDSVLRFPYEMWEFERASYRLNGKIYRIYSEQERDLLPFDPEKGWMIYWNSDSWHGEVFPSRIVPLSRDMEMSGDQVGTYATAPVYEPDYLNAERLFFFASHGEDYYKYCHKLTRLLPYSYRRDITGGALITAFSKEWCNWQEWLESNELQGIRFLYSEDIK